MIEIFTDNGIGERMILVTHYTLTKGYAGHGPRGDCPGCPPEEPCIEDIEAKWEDTGQRLNDEEMEAYQDELVEACFEDANAGREQ